MNGMQRERLGDRLRQLRLERHLTQESLAERAGFHPTYIQKVEAGRITPSLGSLLRLSEALKVPVAAVVESLDEGAVPPAGAVAEITTLLRSCQESQVRFVRDFVYFLTTREGRPTSPRAEP